MSGAVVWRELRPLAGELVRCDYPGCGEPADTIHLVPWCDASCEAALFACPRHDPGGYQFTVESLVGEWIDWQQHLLDKLDVADRRRAVGGWFELARRVDELTYPVVHVDEPPAPESTPPKPAKPKRPRARRDAERRELAGGELTRYGQAALAGLVDELRAAPDGTRNITLNKAAFRAGQLVAADEIAEDVARGELLDAAAAIGLPAREARTTVASGLTGGREHPARIEDR